MLGRDLLDCWLAHLMPHPPLCIWVCPRNQSLQPLYLHYVTMLHLRITLQIYRKEGGAALMPCQLRGPPPLSPACTPPQHLVVTPAPVGSNAQGSSHRLWHQSLTAGHRKLGVVHHPLWTPTPTIISMGQLLASSLLALPSWWGPLLLGHLPLLPPAHCHSLSPPPDCRHHLLLPDRRHHSPPRRRNR